jgi:hypothetical protein
VFLLRDNVVSAHILPAGSGMAVEKSQPGTGLGRLDSRAFKILRQKAGVAVDPAITGVGWDEAVEQSSLAM